MKDINCLLLLDFEIVNNKFYENFMILIPGKSHYIYPGKNLDDNEMLNFSNLTIKSSKEVEILGIKIDNKLNFNNHIKSIWRKAGQKLSKKSLIWEYLLTSISKKKKVLYKSMLKSQFSFAP